VNQSAQDEADHVGKSGRWILVLARGSHLSDEATGACGAEFCKQGVLSREVPVDPTDTHARESGQVFRRRGVSPVSRRSRAISRTNARLRVGT
jgi:hypothetical protein